MSDSIPRLCTIQAIGVDWGTTNLRAWAYNANGEIVDHRSSPMGILNVENGAFEATLNDVVGDWLQADSGIPVIASGMITSQQGWVELDYLDCPVDPVNLVRVSAKKELSNGNQIYFVTGLRFRDELGRPDIMRGEETQIAGLVALDSCKNTTVILPGTHSKWVQLDKDQRIRRFGTYMTGEIYAILSQHSILHHSVVAAPAGSVTRADTADVQAFKRGYETAKQSHGRILNRLFHTRTYAVCDAMTADDASQYLSGLLIGAEVLEGLTGISHENKRFVLVGDQALVHRYREVLGSFGHSAEVAPESSTAIGLWSQYKSLVSA